MNGAGDDLLASAGFALNQGHRVGFGDHANQGKHLLKCRTDTNDLFVHYGA